MSMFWIVANVVSIIVAIIWFIGSLKGVKQVAEEIHYKKEVMQDDEKHASEISDES